MHAQQTEAAVYFNLYCCILHKQKLLFALTPVLLHTFAKCWHTVIAVLRTQLNADAGTAHFSGVVCRSIFWRQNAHSQQAEAAVCFDPCVVVYLCQTLAHCHSYVVH